MKKILTKELFNVLFSKTEASLISIFDYYKSYNNLELKYSFTLNLIFKIINLILMKINKILFVFPVI